VTPIKQNIKDIDRKLLKELLLNSRRSDRELSKAIGVSQPTITRRRQLLEKQFIEAYTILPVIRKMDFEIMAFVFAERVMKQIPSNVITSAEGHGLGCNAVYISLHKNFADFDSYITKNFSGIKHKLFLINTKTGFLVPYNKKGLTEIV
jgi:DNA-binding Lrp family transcriptional regulator